jgi:DNA-binding transcriptional LysR family regulator
MDFAHLSLVKDIVARRSISRGASDHGITQSAASQVVQEFERSLGVHLLDRSRRPLEVTPAGRLLYDFAVEVLERRRRLLAEVDNLRDEPAGAVRVASIYSVGLSEMARLESDFRLRLPQGRLEVDYLRPEMVYAAVLGGKADLGLVSYPEPRRGLVVLAWRREPLVVAAAPSHRLARLARVRLASLDGEEFIGFDSDLPISRHIERLFREAGVQVRCRLRFDSISAVKEALQLGGTLAVLPAPMLQPETVEGRLKAIRLVPTPHRPLGVVHPKRPLGKAVRVFLHLLAKPGRV